VRSRKRCRSVIEWVTKDYLELFRASEGTLSRWSRLHLQSFVPTNPHWARVVGYGRISLCGEFISKLFTVTSKNNKTINKQNNIIILIIIISKQIKNVFNILSIRDRRKDFSLSCMNIVKVLISALRPEIYHHKMIVYHTVSSKINLSL
jgi:hypothetical protein